jgi:hypothetical protein
MAATILTSVFASGGRTARYGDFTVVFMHGASFITTPMELVMNQNWARGRVSSGNAVKDRTQFVERFETVLGRVGSGIASKGSRGLLARIVKSMKANALFLEEWSIPRDLEAGVEMKKKPVAPPQPVLAVAVAAEPAANEVPSSVTPFVPR